METKLKARPRCHTCGGNIIKEGDPILARDNPLKCLQCGRPYIETDYREDLLREVINDERKKRS